VIGEFAVHFLNLFTGRFSSTSSTGRLVIAQTVSIGIQPRLIKPQKARGPIGMLAPLGITETFFA